MRKNFRFDSPVREIPKFLPDTSTKENRQDISDDERVEDFFGEERPLADARQTHRVRHRNGFQLYWDGIYDV